MAIPTVNQFLPPLRGYHMSKTFHSVLNVLVESVLSFFYYIFSLKGVSTDLQLSMELSIVDGSSIGYTTCPKENWLLIALKTGLFEISSKHILFSRNIFYEHLLVAYRYTLQASTFQMAVLLQYNGGLSWTLQQLQELTQLKAEFTLQVVQILLKSKLLQSSDDETNLQPSSVIELNTGYKK